MLLVQGARERLERGLFQRAFKHAVYLGLLG
jgi:hypothetical protein